MGIETALIGAGLGLVGSSIQKRSVDKATDAQSAASADAIAEQRRQYDTTREDFAPYRAAGQNALQSLVGQMGQQVTPQDVMSDPGYQFAQEQGQQAIDRKFSASGGRISGASLKAASRFNTGTATAGYNAAYQRRQDTLNRLAAIAGVGQSSTGASAAAGGQSSNAISGLIANQGDNAGAGRLAQGNIWGNAFNDIGAQFMRRKPGDGGGGGGGGSFGPQLDSFFGGKGGSGE